MGAMADLSFGRARTTKTPMAEAMMPKAGTIRGNTTARAAWPWNDFPREVNAANPRMMAATMVMT